MVVKKLKLAIFISGRGSNMISIIDACRNARFPAEVSLVLSNRPDAEGITLAKNENIATEIVDHRSFDSRETFENEICNQLDKHDFDLIVLAGFMRVLTSSFVEKWPDQIINIHPSLLPDYKGLHTHARAIADGKKEAGCTVHFVIPDLDSGPTILQKRVPIHHDDTPETLAERVLEQEHTAYPQAIEIIASTSSNQE
ncbi:MAG: phosphoribosylglycinamide formyltransferase [Alphaproteobacteria bacterium]